MNIDKNISSRITVFKFLMICFIIIYHSCINIESEAPIDIQFNSTIIDVQSTLGVIAMSFFFCVTGFLLFHNLNMTTYKQKIIRRIKTLLIPYFIWQLIGILIMFFSGKSITFQGLIDTIFLLKRWPPDGALWYLYAVFILSVLSIIFIPLLKNKKVFFVIVILFSLISYAISSIPGISDIFNYGYLQNITSYIPAFLIGAFYGYYYSEKDEASSLKYVFIMIIISLIFNSIHNGIFEFITKEMLPIFMLYLIPAPNKIQNYNVFKLSFLMYALHQLLTDFYIAPMSRLFLNTAHCILLYNILGTILYLDIITLLSLLIYMFLEKYSPKVLSLITGNRT